MPQCHYCGSEWFIDIPECWSTDRAFALDGCCAQTVEESTKELIDRRRDADVRDWFYRTLGIYPRRLFVSGDGCLRIDFGLRIVDLKRKPAQAFIRQHHRHCPPPPGDKYRCGVMNGHDLVGVAMAGRQVARMIDATEVLEVNRVCVNASINANLSEHACSMLYGSCYRFAKRQGFRKLVTYTLQDEPGTSLIAAGFELDGTTSGGSWSRTRRHRTDKSPTGSKSRWVKSC